MMSFLWRSMWAIPFVASVFMPMVNAESWQHTLEPHLDDLSVAPTGFAYKMSWNITSTDVVLRIEAPTTGWLAFGIGEDGAGGMPGADIVACTAEGWLSDRFATKYSLPAEDVQQDWTMISSGTTSGGSGSFCTVQRTLVTGDLQDRALSMERLQAAKLNILMAYGDTDTFSYHGLTSRSTAQIDLLHPGNGTLDVPESDMTVLLQNSDITIPHDDTTCTAFGAMYSESTCFSPVTQYYRQFFNVTQYSGRSIIAFVPFVNPASKSHVHHFTVDGFGSDDCSYSNYFGNMYIWAPGTGPMIFPDPLGVRIGGASGVKCIRVETHYDNPTHAQNVVDDSGIRLYLTSTSSPRPTDVGSFGIGDPSIRLDQTALLPGLSKQEFVCHQGTFEGMQEDITVFAVFHHMHVAGKMMETTLVRDGLSNTTWSTEFYDFNFQTLIPVNLTISADQLPSFESFCVFDSAASTSYPFSTPSGKWGFGSDDEMCITFLHYYPRIDGFTNCELVLNSDIGLPNASSPLPAPNLPTDTNTIDMAIEIASSGQIFTMPSAVHCIEDDTVDHLVYCEWNGTDFATHWIYWANELESNQCKRTYSVSNPDYFEFASENGELIFHNNYRVHCTLKNKTGSTLVSNVTLSSEALLSRVFGTAPATSPTAPPTALPDLESSNGDSGALSTTTVAVIGGVAGAVVLLVIIVIILVMRSKKAKAVAANESKSGIAINPAITHSSF